MIIFPTIIARIKLVTELSKFMESVTKPTGFSASLSGLYLLGIGTFLPCFLHGL